MKHIRDYLIICFNSPTRMSSKFGRWLFLNWPQLYVKAGAIVWLGKAGRDTKEDLDNLTENQHYIKNDILPLTGYNLLYYSPNVLFWPVNFTIDSYQWGVIKYYENCNSVNNN